MKITLDLDETDIKALNNAGVVFNREIWAAQLGCESWLRDELKKKYPDLSPFDLDDMLEEQRNAYKKIMTLILEDEGK